MGGLPIEDTRRDLSPFRWEAQGPGGRLLIVPEGVMLAFV